MCKCLQYPVLLWLLLSCFFQAHGQEGILTGSSRQVLPGSLSMVEARALQFESKLERQTERYLSRLSRQEKRLKRKLSRKDPLAAKALFGEPEERYAKLRGKLKSEEGETASYPNTYMYMAHLDSMKTVLSFLREGSLPEDGERLEASLEGYNRLQHKLSQSEQVGQFILGRQQRLEARLEEHGLGKQFRVFRKQAYYYKAQVGEYRQLIAHPSRQEQRFLQAARNHPAFQDYFRRHAQLASMFRMPGSDMATADGNPLPGLQTISGLQQAFKEKLGQQAEEVLEQNMQHVEDEFGRLKARVTEAGNPEAAQIPGFRPNSQKTKGFWKRLEVGSDFQTTKGNSSLPVTSDIGLSLGYRVSDRSVTGLGASYKVGWGEGIKRIDISHQGMGFRSFLDWRLKGSFWASAGAEINYRPELNRDIAPLQGYNPWQRAAMLGITKKYRINSRYGGKVQLLYDFLHRRHLPRSQPVLFRVGYAF